jgi:GWxTD domain-containing protein
LGLRKPISDVFSIEIAYRGHHFSDKDPSLEDWHLLSVATGFHFPVTAAGQFVESINEAEVVLRYLAPELAEPVSRFPARREELLEQFWRSHDPTPETAENEFRSEIQRRIRHANIRFKDVDEGWKTERGRVWILYGDPDEILIAEEDISLRPQHVGNTVCWIYHREHRGVSPLVFVFQQIGTYKQVFSNVPGESGYSRPIGTIDPEIDRYTRKAWPDLEYRRSGPP